MAGVLNNDRKLGAEVRRMTLNMLKGILADEDNKKYDEKFRREVLLKLATNALPRQNENTGEDGGPIIIQVAQEILQKNDITSGTENSGEGRA